MTTPEEAQDEACAREACDWDRTTESFRLALIFAARLSREREAERHKPKVDQDVLDVRRLLSAWGYSLEVRDDEPDVQSFLATFRTILKERGL